MNKSLLGLTRLLLSIGGVSCWSAASLATEDVQLYLTSDAVPKKGYIDADQDGNDSKVAFRECEAPPGAVIWVDPKSLTAITGNCEKIWALWGGTVTNITPSFVTIVTSGNDALNVDAVEFRKAFGSDTTKWPSVGDAVGGYNLKNPVDLFAIDPKWDLGG